MTKEQRSALRPFWKWTLLYPCFGLAAYVLGASACAIVGSKPAAKLVYLLDLVFAAPTLILGMHAMFAADPTVPLKTHAYLALSNVGIYLVFGVLHGLKAEGYKAFRIAYWALFAAWVLLWMRYLG